MEHSRGFWFILVNNIKVGSNSAYTTFQCLEIEIKTTILIVWTSAEKIEWYFRDEIENGALWIF
jgi:hypothetical protein